MKNLYVSDLKMVLLEICITSLRPGEGKSTLLEAFTHYLRRNNDQGIVFLALRELNKIITNRTYIKEEKIDIAQFEVSLKLYKSHNIMFITYDYQYVQVPEIKAYSYARTYTRNFAQRNNIQLIINEAPYSITYAYEIASSSEITLLVVTPYDIDSLKRVLPRLEPSTIIIFNMYNISPRSIEDLEKKFKDKQVFLVPYEEDVLKRRTKFLKVVKAVMKEAKIYLKMGI